MKATVKTKKSRNYTNTIPTLFKHSIKFRAVTRDTSKLAKILMKVLSSTPLPAENSNNFKHNSGKLSTSKALRAMKATISS